MTHATVAALNVYPVKSCRGISLEQAVLELTGFRSDRRWMVVTETGHYLTQRQLPRMALIVPELTPQGLSITAPGMPALSLPEEMDGPSLEVSVVFDRVLARDAGPQAAAWLSQFLERSVRLVRFDPQLTRRINSLFWKGDIETRIEFSDAFPLLVVSQASLEDLNNRLEWPLPMDRFRPNVVLDGLQAYDEDRIHNLRDGALQLRIARACTRCKITTTNQLTGEVLGAEPLTTLKAYRWSKALRGIMFGQYAIVVDGVGTQLRVGQRLEIEWKGS